jgi:hypothetical protein
MGSLRTDWWPSLLAVPETEPKSPPQVHANTRAFRGASFHNADLSGATFRDCDMSGVRIVSSRVDGLVISGLNGRAGRVVVDDVDVSAYVAAELDRRHPERVRLREARTAKDLRAVWADLERLWEDTLARAGWLPEAALQERVDGEWSFVETLRHLVFAVDSWVGGWLRGEAAPFSPLALPPTDLAVGGVADDRPRPPGSPYLRRGGGPVRRPAGAGARGPPRGDRRRAGRAAHRHTGAGLGRGDTPGRGVPARGAGGALRAPSLRPARPRRTAAHEVRPRRLMAGPLPVRGRAPFSARNGAPGRGYWDVSATVAAR